ncbi:MAG: hypothetical protein JXJ04_23480 [Spirochaetales bacterium]|nr:hypothetical protein [Spirochaetales bacterium]
MIMKESDYICPGCKSSVTNQFRPTFIAASGMLLIGIGAWTFYIPVVGLVFIILGTVMVVASPFLKDVHICKECRKIWRIKPVTKVSPSKIINFMERSQKYKKNNENK